jgi:hypothetical protein
MAGTLEEAATLCAARMAIASALIETKYLGEGVLEHKGPTLEDRGAAPKARYPCTGSLSRPGQMRCKLDVNNQ